MKRLLIATIAAALVQLLGAYAFGAGPGTEMTRIINNRGLGSDCGRCKALADQMDRGGPQWVRANRGYVVRSTIKNAEALGNRMGISQRLGVRLTVRLANWRAGR